MIVRLATVMRRQDAAYAIQFAASSDACHLFPLFSFLKHGFLLWNPTTFVRKNVLALLPNCTSLKPSCGIFLAFFVLPVKLHLVSSHGNTPPPVRSAKICFQPWACSLSRDNKSRVHITDFGPPFQSTSLL